jgi:ribosome maturation factor RimP
LKAWSEAFRLEQFACRITFAPSCRARGISSALAAQRQARYIEANISSDFAEWEPSGPALFYYLKGPMSFDLTEQRFIKETGLEARVARIVEPVANGLGFSLVRVKITQENGCTLQIMAEDEHGRFTIVNCEALSKDLSPVLDVEDPIDREYHLEVSSPGIDRPLVRRRDFQGYIGHEAKIELGDMINGRKRFRGFIKAVEDDAVIITLPDAPAGTDPDHRLPFRNLAEAKLVMTDALMEKARLDQEAHPIDDDETETVEYADADVDDEDDISPEDAAGTKPTKETH